MIVLIAFGNGGTSMSRQCGGALKAGGNVVRTLGVPGFAVTEGGSDDMTPEGPSARAADGGGVAGPMVRVA